MPYVTSDGFDTYYEVMGNGPPLAIYHGMTGSLESFKDPGFSQYLELQRNYKLILVDIRGQERVANLITQMTTLVLNLHQI